MMKLDIFILIVFFIINITINYCYGQDCPNGEVFNTCGNFCEGDCFKADIKLCVKMCSDPACVCEQGFYRSVSGKCIPYEQCLTSEADVQYCLDKLGPNAMISPTPNCPNQLCGHRPKKFCDRLPGCICKPGYQINKQGRCVEPSQCDM